MKPSTASPPRLVEAALRAALPRDIVGQSIVDDLRGEFRGRAATSLVRARFWYTSQAFSVVVKFALPRAVSAGRPSISSIGVDLKRAGRSLLRDRVYAVAVILSLGLGVGATSGIFAVVNGVLLKPLPYAEADRIVVLQQGAGGAGLSPRFSFLELADYRRESESLTAFAGFGSSQFTVLGGNEAHRAEAGLVSGNFLQLLGLRPFLGRMLIPADDDAGADPVAVLTHAYWQRSFGSDPDVVGSTITLGTGKSLRVVGVLTPGPHYTGARDLYVNFAASDHYVGAAMQEQRGHRMTGVYARMRAGYSVDEVRAELATIANRLSASYPEDYAGDGSFRATATPLKAALTNDARGALLSLLAISVLALVVASGNIMNLALLRMVRLRPTLALRATLGASKARLRWEVLAEAIVLLFVGLILALGVTYGGLQLLSQHAARFTVRVDEISFDGLVIVSAFALAAVAASTCLALPLLRAVREAWQRPTVDRFRMTRATRVRGDRMLQRMLVVAQLGGSLTLLVSGLMFAKTLDRLSRADLGFDPANVLSLRMYEPTAELGRGNRSGETSESARAFTTALLRQLRQAPYVESAAVAGGLPINTLTPRPASFDVEGEGRPLESPASVWSFVDPGYFRTLGVDLLAGRLLRDRDAAGAPAAIVINESMARDLFGGPSAAVGRRIRGAGGASQGGWNTIVGVTSDTRRSIGSEVPHAQFQSWRQGPPYPPSWLLVRTHGDPLAVVPDVRGLIRTLDAKTAVANVRSLVDVRSELMGSERLNAVLVNGFALIALILSAIGVAGVLSLEVAGRRHEIGIRVALGAERSEVLAMLMTQALGMIVSGCVMGLVLAVAFVRISRNLIPDLEVLGVSGYLLPALFLIVVAGIAAWMPARRALNVSPVEACRAS